MNASPRSRRGQDPADRAGQARCRWYIRRRRVFHRACLRGMVPMSDPGHSTLSGRPETSRRFRALADDIKGPGPALEAATRAAALPCSTRCGSPSPKGGRTSRTRPAPTVDRLRWRPAEKKTGRAVHRGRGDGSPRRPRLEYGFVGPDKLGRVYNQAARPAHPARTR